MDDTWALMPLIVAFVAGLLVPRILAWLSPAPVVAKPWEPGAAPRTPAGPHHRGALTSSSSPVASPAASPAFHTDDGELSSIASVSASSAPSSPAADGTADDDTADDDDMDGVAAAMHATAHTLLMPQKMRLDVINLINYCFKGKADSVRATLRESPHLLFCRTTANTAMGSHGYSFTPLHAAVYGGRVDVVALLIELGADVLACDIHGRLPLHVGAEKFEMVCCQVRRGGGGGGEGGEMKRSGKGEGGGGRRGERERPAIHCSVCTVCVLYCMVCSGCTAVCILKYS